jgi:hypothetical protein
MYVTLDRETLMTRVEIFDQLMRRRMQDAQVGRRSGKQHEWKKRSGMVGRLQPASASGSDGAVVWTMDKDRDG